MNETCEDCIHFIEKESEMTDEQIVELLDDDDAEGVCNYYGYPVSHRSNCWHFASPPDAE